MKIKSAYLILSASLIIGSVNAQTRQVKESLIASVNASNLVSYAVSNDLHRVAYRIQIDDKQIAVVDDNKGNPFDIVTLPVFSPDNRHFAYAGKKGKEWQLIVDNKIDQVFINSKIISLQFSPDSWALAVIINEDDKYYLNINGADGKSYDYIDENSLVFTQDSKKVAFTAGVGNKRLNVIDGSEGTLYEQVGYPVLSHDGKHFAYWAVGENHTYVVLDNQESRSYDAVNMIMFNAKGNSCVYQATRDGKHIVVLDGVESDPFEIVHSLQFSPDGAHLAYAIETIEQKSQENKTQVVKEEDEEEDEETLYAVLDGKKFGPYSNVVEGSLKFSQDGKQFAFKAGRHDEFFMVIDGKEGKPYSDVLQVTSTFSQDNQFAYAGETNSKRFVNAAGVESNPYNDVYSISYSPDNKTLAYSVRLDNKEFVVVNGMEGKSYDSILGSGSIAFDSQGKLHYLTLKGDNIYLVEENF